MGTEPLGSQKHPQSCLQFVPGTHVIAAFIDVAKKNPLPCVSWSDWDTPYNPKCLEGCLPRHTAEKLPPFFFPNETKGTFLLWEKVTEKGLGFVAGLSAIGPLAPWHRANSGTEDLLDN